MFRLRISTPLAQDDPPKQLIELTNAVQSGSFSLSLPGGFANASLQLRPGWREPVPSGAHIEIFPEAGELSGGICWEGQRRRPHFKGRDLATLEASGYALTLSDADTLSTAQLKTASEQQLAVSDILQYAMRAIAPSLHVGAPFGSPAVYHPLSLYDGRNLWDIATQLGTENGYDWGVWERRLATFTARTLPTTPDYQIAVDDCPDWELDDASIFTRVAVKYTDASTGVAAQTADQVDSLAETALGTTRRTVVDGGTMDASGALAYARTTLRTSVLPVLRATLGPLQSLRRYLGGRTPGYAVRPGEWVQIGGYGENRGTAVIVDNTVDWNTGNVTLQLGAPVLDHVGTLAQVTAAVLRVKGGTNLNTLARA